MSTIKTKLSQNPYSLTFKIAILSKGLMTIRYSLLKKKKRSDESRREKLTVDLKFGRRIDQVGKDA